MNLKKAALSFQELLDIEYKIIVGRKNKSTEFVIKFNKDNFFHLVGLQKLDDIDFPTNNKEKLFDLILQDKINDEFISKSRNFKTIFSERLLPFIDISKIMDNNNLVFKFNKNHNNWTEVSCEFILENIDWEKTIYIFIDKDKDCTEMFCRSFFVKSNKDFTARSTKMYLLYKEKINRLTGESEIQFNKLD